MEKYKIVTDSSADLTQLGGVPFGVAPLKIITEEGEYTDDRLLDVSQMVEELYRYRGSSSTSCPNPDDWLRAFGRGENIFCVTITGTLSGSYHSAVIAKEIYEERFPGRRVFVLDSLSAGPELKLMVEKLKSLITAGLPYEEICARITAYREETALLFLLESMKNLANNGRVSSFKANVAGLLGIRVVGKASERGDLEALEKCRGQEKAISALLRYMEQMGLTEGKVCISHCMQETGAEKLREHLLKKFPRCSVEVQSCRGLCSYYAERGGLLVAFEKC